MRRARRTDAVTDDGHSPLGVASFFLGAASIVVVVVVAQLQLYMGAVTSVLLRTLDRIGLVKAPEPGTPIVFEAIRVFSLTDKSVLALLLWNGVAWAVGACALALVAEAKHERTLYLSAGFVCGAMALHVVDARAGMVAAVIGSIALIVLRRRRG